MGKISFRNLRRAALRNLLGSFHRRVQTRQGRLTALESLEPRHYMTGNSYVAAMDMMEQPFFEDWTRESSEYPSSIRASVAENITFQQQVGGLVGVFKPEQNNNAEERFFTLEDNLSIDIQIGGSAVIGKDFELWFDQEDGTTNPAPIKINGTTLQLSAGGLNYGELYIKPINNSKIDGTRSIEIELLGTSSIPVDADSNFTRAEIKDDDFANEQLCPCDCGCEQDTIVKLEESSGYIEIKSNVSTQGESIRSPEESSVALRVFAPLDKQPLINVITYLPRFDTSLDVALVEVTIENFLGSSSNVTKYFEYDAYKAGKSITYDIRGNLSPIELDDLELGLYDWNATLKYYRYNESDELVPVYINATTTDVEDFVEGQYLYKGVYNPILGTNCSLSGFSCILGNLGNTLMPDGDIMLFDGVGNALYFRYENDVYLPSAGDLNDNRISPVYEEVAASYGGGQSSSSQLVHYRVVDKYGFTRIYNLDGTIKEQLDRNGNSTIYEYNRQLDVLEDIVVTEPNGRQTKIAFSESSGVKTIKYITNAQLSSTYQTESEYKFDGSSGNLTSIIYPAAEDGSLKRTYFAYDSEGRLTSVTDKKVVSSLEVPTRRTGITYDEDLEMATAIKQYRWDSTTSTYVETDSMPIHAYQTGHASEATQGTEANPAPLTLTNERYGLKTSYGTTLSGTPAGATVEKFQSDAYGRTVLTSIPGLGTTEIVRLNSGLPSEIFFTPDQANTWDVASKVQYEYDDEGVLGNVTSTKTYKKDTNDNWVLFAEQTYDYDNGIYSTFGQPTQVRDEYDRITEFTLDQFGNVLSSRIIIGGKDGVENSETNDLVTAYTYTDGSESGQENVPRGLLRTVTDPKMQVTEYLYHNVTNSSTGAFLGELQQVELPTSNNPTRSFAYDTVGNLKTYTDELGRVTKYEHSNRGLLTKLTLADDPDGGGAQTGIFYTYQYDSQQRITQQTAPNPDGTHTQVTTNFTYGKELFQGKWLQFTKTTLVATGQQTIEYYDANRNLVYSVDPLGRVSENSYSTVVNSQLDEVMLPDPDGPSGPLTSLTAKYNFDLYGRVRNVKTDLPVVTAAPEFQNLTVNVTTASAIGTVDFKLAVESAFPTSQLTHVRFEILGYDTTAENSSLFDKLELISGQKPGMNFNYSANSTGTAVIKVRAVLQGNSSGSGATEFTVTVQRTVLSTSPVLHGVTPNAATTAPTSNGNYVVALVDNSGTYSQNKVYLSDSRNPTVQIPMTINPATIIEDFYLDGYSYYDNVEVATYQSTSGTIAVAAWKHSYQVLVQIDDGNGGYTTEVQDYEVMRYSVYNLDTDVFLVHDEFFTDSVETVRITPMINNPEYYNGGFFAAYEYGGYVSVSSIDLNGNVSWDKATFAINSGEISTFKSTNTGGVAVAIYDGSTYEYRHYYFNSSYVLGSVSSQILPATGDVNYLITSDGGKLIAWLETNSNYAVQRFAADGTPTGPKLNIDAIYGITTTADNGFAVIDFDNVRIYGADNSLLQTISTSGYQHSFSNSTFMQLTDRAFAAVTRSADNVYVKRFAALDTPAAQPGSFRVTGINPGQNISGEVKTIQVDFSAPINWTTINTTQFAIALNGETLASAISSITALSSTQAILVLTAPLSAIGEYSVTVTPGLQKIGGGVIDQDRDGTPGETGQDNYQGYFTISAKPDLGTNPTAVSSTVYDLLNRPTSTTDALGRVTTYVYHPELVSTLSGFSNTRLRHVTVTAPGEATDGSDKDLITDLYYDEAERLVFMQLPEVLNPSNSTYTRPSFKHEYDKNGNLIKSTENRGFLTALAGDDLRITDYDYDAQDRLIKVQSPVNDGKRLVTLYNYDAAGQLIRQTDQIDISSTFTTLDQTGYFYDDLGRLTRIVRSAPTFDTSVANPAATLNSADDYNSILAATGSVVIGYEYNKLGQQTREILPDPKTGQTFSSDNLTGTTPVSGAVITVSAYDQAGRLSTVTEGFGHSSLTVKPVTTYIYDAANNLIRIKDHLNQFQKYEYDALNRVIKTASGKTVSVWNGSSFENVDEVLLRSDYAFDQAGNLSAMTDALGRRTGYFYDALGRQTGMINPLGQLTTSSYDTAGNMASATDAAGRISKLTHDALGRTRTIARPNPSSVGSSVTDTLSYDLGGNLVNSEQVQNRNTTGVATFTAKTQSVYDKWDRLIEVRRPDPTTGEVSTTNKFTYSFSEVIGLTQVTDPLGRESATVTDRWGRTITEISANPQSGKISVTVGGNTQIVGRETNYAYDYLGRMTELTQADPDLVLAYNAGTNTYTSTDGNLARPRFHYDYDALGRMTRSIKPNPTTGVSVDTFGQPVSGAAVTDYTYDAIGQLSTVLGPSFSTTYNNATVDSRQKTDYYYDAVGRVSQTQVGSVNAANLGQSLVYANQISHYNYDVVGNLVSTVERPGTEFSRISQTRYDALNRPVELIDARDGRTSFTYDTSGNQTSITDAVGNTTSYEFDRRDRTVLDINELQKRRSFAYDDADRLTTRTDRNNKVRAFEYDALNRLDKEKWKNLAGDVLRTFDYDYDAADQLLNIADDRGTSWTQDDLGLEFGFDSAGRITQSKQKFAEFAWPMTGGGSIAPPANPNNSNTTFTFTTNFTFDQLDRRTKSAVDWSMNQYENSTPVNYSEFENLYEYDSQSRLTNLRQQIQSTPLNWAFTPVSKNVAFTYNTLDRFTKIERTFKANSTDTTWHEAAFSDSQYDPLGRLAELKHDRVGSKALYNLGSTFNTHQYAYDALNRITSWTSVDGAATYAYDGVGQLNTVDNPSQLATVLPDENYQHDLNGNRWQKGTTTVTTGANNKVLDDGTYTYSYDDEGNRQQRVHKTTGETTTYEYDHRNRMSAVRTWTSAALSVETQRVVLDYDAFDRRVLRIHATFDTAGNRTGFYSSRYAYDGWDVVLDVGGGAWIPDSGFAFTVTRYLWAPSDRAGETSLLLSSETVNSSNGISSYGAVNWVFADHQNTTRDILRMNGTTQGIRAEHLQYDAFGNYVGSISAPGLGALLVRYLYTGQEWDIVVGLHYYNHRWYDSLTASFTTEDPIVWEGGLWNLTNYVGNDPVNYTDPSGLVEETVGGAVRAAEAMAIFPEDEQKRLNHLARIKSLALKANSEGLTNEEHQEFTNGRNLYPFHPDHKPYHTEDDPTICSLRAGPPVDSERQEYEIYMQKRGELIAMRKWLIIGGSDDEWSYNQREKLTGEIADYEQKAAKRASDRTMNQQLYGSPEYTGSQEQHAHAQKALFWGAVDFAASIWLQRSAWKQSRGGGLVQFPPQQSCTTGQTLPKGGTNGVRSAEPIAPTTSSQSLWTRTQVQGRTVYQRNNLFDPARRSSWVDPATGQWRSGTNVQRMGDGLAPIGTDGRPLQLHHLTGTEVNGLNGTRGSVAEVTATFHQQNTSTLHIPNSQPNPNYVPGGNHPRQIPQYPSFRRDNAGNLTQQAQEFDAFREAYWRNRASGFQGN